MGVKLFIGLLSYKNVLVIAIIYYGFIHLYNLKLVLNYL